MQLITFQTIAKFFLLLVLVPGVEQYKDTQEVGFLSQVYNPVCEFWTQTGLSLKITEPYLPNTNEYPVRATNYFPNCR